jgi:hypothetical protein
MSMWTAIMVLGIVAIVQFGRVQRAKYQAQHGLVEDRTGRVQFTASPREGELQREIEALRERIKVLERIATDERQSRSIAAEIESLRDR